MLGMLFAPLVWGDSPFTGQFMADIRPNQLIYISIVQVERSVSGLMIIVTAAQNGKTDKATLSLDGVVDNTSLTLREKRFFGDYVLTGRREGESLVLIFPGNDGGITPVTFHEATEFEYSAVLSEWQTNYAEIYRESSNITNHAKSLAELITQIESTGIPSDLLELSNALSQQKEISESFQELKKQYSKITGFGKSDSCDYVYSNVSTFFYDKLSDLYYSEFQPIDGHFRRTYSRLDERVSNAPVVVTKARESSSLFREALSKRKYPLPELPKLPTDEEKIINTYMELSNSAVMEAESIGSQYVSLADEVREIMQESQDTLTRMQVECL